MFPDASLLLEDSLDGKRRRIARVGLLYACWSDICVMLASTPAPDLAWDANLIFVTLL
jgi:hypothetical protein